MQSISIDRTAVNVEALDADLRAALGVLTSGISVGRGQVIVHLLDTATPAQINQARAVVQAHDPARLTPEQQTRAARRARLEQSRQDYGAAELDLTAFTGQSALVRLLAQKIAWLEQEINTLRLGS
jgi:hypothetical protein